MYQKAYKKAIKQAADYGQKLESFGYAQDMLDNISLIFPSSVRTCFVDAIVAVNRQKYEVTTMDGKTGVLVEAIFVATS